MCGRYDIDQTTIFQIIEKLHVNPNHELGMMGKEICPSEVAPIIFKNRNNQYCLKNMNWWLRPSWAKDVTVKYPTFNARAETLTEKPTFRGAFQKGRRCLIPARQWFEWTGKKGEKIKHTIYRDGNLAIAFAGLYDIWREGTPDEHWSFTIVTCEANEIVRPYHAKNRMPVILAESDWKSWLDPANHDWEYLKSLLKPCPDSWLKISD